MGLVETIVLAATMTSMSALVALLTRDYGKAKARATAEYRRATTLATAFVSELDRRMAQTNESYERLGGEVAEIRRSLDRLEGQVSSADSAMASKANAEELHSQHKDTESHFRLLEDRFARLQTLMSVQRIQPLSSSVSQPFVPRLWKLNATQRRILDILKEGTKSYREIQDPTGLSREHVSRELKRLFELGFVERDEGVRPYEYQLLVQLGEKVEDGTGSTSLPFGD